MNMDVDEAAKDFVKFFDQLSIPYAVIGGLAVRTHALPRPTWDVDFIAQLPRSEIHRLIQLAEEHGFTIDEALKKGWVENLRSLPLIKFQMFVEGGKIDVDIFLAETEFLQQLIDRRSMHNDGTWSAYFISPEDLILMKLMANRLKDQVDVEDIFFMQGQLDESYMREWARKLNVLPLLEQALAKQKAK